MVSTTVPGCPLPTHLKEAVPNQGHEELVPVQLPHQGSILRGVHAGEVEHGHIGLPIVVDGKVQGWQLLLGGEVSGLPGIVQQSLLVHVVPGQQQLCVGVVLAPKREEAHWRRWVQSTWLEPRHGAHTKFLPAFPLQQCVFPQVFPTKYKEGWGAFLKEHRPCC